MYSVVIPLFNHARFIEDAIHSVQHQSIPAKEIIVIDDGSTDDGADVVLRMSSGDNRILLWKQENRGAHTALNAGFRRATSDVIAILNSDDVYESRRLEVSLDKFSGDPTLSGVSTGLFCINEVGDVVDNAWYENALSSGIKDDDMSLALLNANYILTTSNLVIKRAVFDRIGGFSPLRYAHDLEFFVRMLREDFKIGFIQEKLLKYRMHESNTINENHRKVRIELAAIIAWYMYRLMDSSNSPNMHLSKMRRMLAIAQTHNLLGLVQWMSWICEYASHSECAPFDLPDWPDIVMAAVGIDK